MPLTPITYLAYSNTEVPAHKLRILNILKTWISKYRFKLVYPSKVSYLEEIINKLLPPHKAILLRALQTVTKKDLAASINLYRISLDLL